MPLTVPINLMSIAYPDITNRIRVDVATQADPNTIVATEIDSVVGHPARIWMFLGLQRTNYIVTMNEIDSSGNPIFNLAYFDVVPTGVFGAIVREDEQIFPDTTPGLISGTTHAKFDGTAGAPDYRGWNINPERRAGGGTMIRGQEYSWDSVTGDFNLLTSGDVLQAGELINIDFDPKEVILTDSPLSSSFSVRLVTTDDDITTADFGNKIIAEPAGDLITLQLPDISTITANLPLMLECSKDTDCCVNVVPFGIDLIKFAFGKIFLCRGDSLRIYKFIRSTGVYEFRVDQADGNFKTVGKIIDIDNIPTNLINMLSMSGQSVSVNKYARAYDMVLRLPASQVVPYSSWSLSNDNRTQFSYSNGSEFHVPYRLGFYKRNTVSDSAGIFYRMMMEYHKHMQGYSENSSDTIVPPFGTAGLHDKVGSGATDIGNDWWFTNNGAEVAGANQLNLAGVIGGETRPNSYSINQLILI